MQRCQVFEVLDALLQRLKGLTHILQKSQPGAGQPHGARGAVKQAHAQSVFELANRFGQRRLGNAQLPRGRSKRPLTRHLVKGTQLAQTEIIRKNWHN